MTEHVITSTGYGRIDDQAPIVAVTKGSSALHYASDVGLASSDSCMDLRVLCASESIYPIFTVQWIALLPMSLYLSMIWLTIAPIVFDAGSFSPSTAKSSVASSRSSTARKRCSDAARSSGCTVTEYTSAITALYMVKRFSQLKAKHLCKYCPERRVQVSELSQTLRGICCGRVPLSSRVV